MSAPTELEQGAPANRAGFALPLAVLAIAMLTAAVAAGFAATASEAVVNNAQRAQERAYQLAEAGLQQFMVRRSESGFCTGCVTDPTASVDSEYTRVQLNGGYADVVAKRVWNPTSGVDSPMFFIRSTGTDTAARISVGGGTIFAQRTVGVYARWNITTMQVFGALTSFNGITRTGSPTLDGNDGCSGSSLPNIDDIAIAAGSGSSGISFFLSDSTSSSIATMSATQAIDWEEVLAGGVTPDVTIPGGTWPSSFTNWPIIKFTTSATLPTAGQGIIIATADFTVPRGNLDWDGIILVGGRLLSSGTSGSATDIHGAVVTGLNYTLPGAVLPAVDDATDNDILTNGHNIRYRPCYVTDAGHRLRGYSPLSNTWMDNVAAW